MLLQPHTVYLIVFLITLALAVCFGFLMGTIVTERRSTQPKRKPAGSRL